MRKSVSILMISALVLAGCGGVRDSRLNPFNWFGRSKAERVVTASDGTQNPLIPERSGGFLRRAEIPYAGVPVDVIKDLRIERAAGGAIIRVLAVSATQGAYDVTLKADNDGEPVDGVLSYTLLAEYPAGRKRVGPESGREIAAAVFVSDVQLDGVRKIRVVGAKNARSSSRR